VGALWLVHKFVGVSVEGKLKAVVLKKRVKKNVKGKNYSFYWLNHIHL